MKILFAWMSVLAAGISLAWVGGADEAKTEESKVAVTELLPSSSFLFVTFDGTAAHLPAIKETAAWKALEETELTARLLDLGQMLISAAGEEQGVLAREAIEHLRTQGFSIAGSMSGNGNDFRPYGVVVLHDAGRFLEVLEPMIQQAAESAREEVQLKNVEGRDVSFVGTNVPDVEFSWWNESGHLVIGVGLDASDQIIATASGKTDNITKNPLWASLRSHKDYSVDSLAWLDSGRLLDQFGDFSMPPTPAGEALTIREFAELLGLHNIRELTSQTGYKGLQTWQDLRLNADGPLTGLAAILKQRNLSLSELPPMPKATSGFAAATFDLGGSIETVLGTVRSLMQKLEPKAETELDEGLARITEVFGGDLRTDFIDGFGDVWCLYADPAALPIPIGFSPVLTASVKDKGKLVDGIARFVQLAQQAGNQDFTIRQTSKDGREYFSFSLPGMPVVPTIMVTEKWLVASVTPGSAQSMAQRESGKLPSWKPDAKVTAALAELPQEYSSITVSDPAPSYQQLLQLAPMGFSLLEQNVLPQIAGGTLQMPFGLEDLPAAEMVTEPMFPNVTVGYSTESGIGSTTRQSVPANPMGNMSATVGVPVMVALLLPAVQQAREAARRTQSKNNLKQIGLAMHNYHDVFNELPRGTVPNDELEPDERLSWAYSILPFIEQQALHESINGEAGWETEENSQAVLTAVPAFQNPSQSGVRTSPSAGDYVAMAGVGEDAATLENDDPRAGIFGYDRQCRFRDITDGTSNTIMITDASEPNSSYLAGGRATIRGFSQSPYLNGPDGIGSPHAGVVQVLMADGSVRAISVDVDETTLEALATKAGAEVVGEF
jgi:prepilin-type processing-associated H-X9-DG protein